MQPYFLPYIGYFQLLSAVDAFVVYDNIKFTKRGWINRNRMLANASARLFSLPLRKASDALNIVDRQLATDFDRGKMLRKFAGAYAKAPQFLSTSPLLERVIRHPDANLFRFILHSIAETCAHLNIRVRLITASEIPIDHRLKSQEKVLALCRELGATTYVNPIGGQDLYSRHQFLAQGIELRFIRSRPVEYRQFGAEFVPWLSIIDVLMFNSLDVVAKQLMSNYDLI